MEVGNRVRRLNSTDRVHNVIEGQIYTVSAVRENYIHLEGRQGSWSISRFEIVEEPATPQLTEYTHYLGWFRTPNGGVVSAIYATEEGLDHAIRVYNAQNYPIIKKQKVKVLL